MYSAFVHLGMMQDERRIEAYARAIRAVVRPGDVVLDVGCGAGVMTFLALEAGAAKVFAVEPSNAIELARVVARENHITGATFLRSDLREVELPGPVDVIIADLRGAVPIFRDGLAVMDLARRRHLAPGGRMIPLSDRIFVAPIESPANHVSVEGWKRSWGRTSYRSVATIARHQMRRVDIAGDALLTKATLMAPSIDYRKPPPGEMSVAGKCPAFRDGNCHGLGAWFESHLSEDVTLATDPGLGTSIYGHAYFPVEDAIAVKAGDCLEFELRVRLVGHDPVWSWSIGIAGAMSEPQHQSSLRGELFSAPKTRTQ